MALPYEIELLFQNFSRFAGLIALGILGFATFNLLRRKSETPVEFRVEVPDIVQTGLEGKGQVLQNPAIHVHGSTAIQCYCPANGRLLGYINPSTPEGIERIVRKASDAQPEWANTTFSERRRVLRTLLKFVLDNQDKIAEVACIDSGKTRVDASFGELLVTAEKLTWTIKHGEASLKAEKRPTNFLMFYKNNEVRYEPLGVVAACVSWNYPFHNFINPVISALFAGNAIVVKVSEQTAWSSQYYIAVVRAALAACGHSPNLVHTVVCWPSAASALTSHPSISHLTFIGSRQVAFAVAASASSALTPMCLELGGKDAAIVLDSLSNSSLPKIASILMRGVFQSAGQNCIGIERIVVTPKHYTALIDLVLPRIVALKIGSPLEDSGPESAIDIGACVSDRNFDKLEGLISEATTQGARLLYGGARYTHPSHPKGHYFTPTLLVDVTPSMRIAQEELFAPVFLVMHAESTEEAIAIANSAPEYSLGCSVFGGSPNSADVETVVQGVKAGMVSVNDFAVYYVCGMPFGGAGGSGYGRFGGKEGLRSLCNVKSVCKDRWRGIISTSIPPRLDYGSKGAEQKRWEFARGVVGLGYGERLKSLKSILGNL